jgi:hypothetical protein
MRPQAFLGVALIIVGVLILVYQGFSYTRTTNVLNVGPLQVNAEKKETVPISPIVGAICLGAGILVTVIGSRRS